MSKLLKAKNKKPAGTICSAGLVNVGLMPGVYAIDQVTHAKALHIQTHAHARGTGPVSPTTGEEPENIRKIIRPAAPAEQVAGVRP
jgi:hypothetical protein